MFIRVLGSIKRIYGGWERRDRIKIDGRQLEGYILFTRRNGLDVETTNYKGRMVPGVDIAWLKARNVRVGVKVAA